MTTKREYEDRARVFAALARLGITEADAQALRRISMTLHRWHEHECDGTIQRDGENQDGIPRRYNPNANYLDPRDPRYTPAIPDRERGALKRLAAIMAKHPTLGFYVQGDPRGCALYILRPGDVPAGEDAGSYYPRGIAVY